MDGEKTVETTPPTEGRKVDAGPVKMDRREFLASTWRGAAGVAGAFALLAMAKIDSVVALDEPTKKALSETSKKDVVEDGKHGETACICGSCPCGPTNQQGVFANSIEGIEGHLVPVTSGTGLAILAGALGAAGAWQILRQRAKNKAEA